MNDLEIYWEAASRIAGAAGLILTGCVLNRFGAPFLQNRKYARVPGMVYAAVMLVLYIFPWYNGLLIVNVFGMASFFAAMYAVDKRNIRQKVFLAVVGYLLKWITGGFSHMMWGLFGERIVLSNGRADQPFFSLAVFCIMETVYAAAAFGIQILACDMIGRAYVCKKENMTRREFLLMISPFTLILLGYFIFAYWERMYWRDVGIYIEDAHPEYMWVQFCYQMLSFVAMLTIIVIYQNIKGIRRQEQENAVLAQQMTTMERHISEVEALYRDIRGLRHDMGNHVMILENLLEKGEREEAAAYLSEWKKQGDGGASEMKSGNPVTDVILTEKKKEMEEKGILFTCDFHYPQGTNINAFDISIILHNVLDNAIYGAAQCQNPYIRLCAYCRKNAYMIEVSNTLLQKIVLEEESGLPETTKGTGGEHGYGLANVKRVAARYFGGIDIVQSKTEFQLTVMLMLA